MTAITYDPDGRLFQTIQSSGGTVLRTPRRATRFPASLTDANSHATSFAYDGFDRLSTTSWPDSSTEVLGYDADGNVLSRQTRAGDTIAFTYDSLNRLSSKAAPGEAAVRYAYDLAGHLTGVSDTSAAIATPAAAASYATALTYDPLNRPIAVSWSPAPAPATPTANNLIKTSKRQWSLEQLEGTHLRPGSNKTFGSLSAGGQKMAQLSLHLFRPFRLQYVRRWLMPSVVYKPPTHRQYLYCQNRR